MRKLPLPLGLLAVITVIAYFVHQQAPVAGPPALNITRPTPQSSAQGKEYLLCFWNVENFFDDKDDHRSDAGDRDYDPWFANHPEMLRLKLEKLCEALLKLNEGRGPDILALAEVESVRAAELLQQALNARLADPALHYTNLLMKEVSSGRHIAPAILTRLPVVGSHTQLIGSRLRILKGHFKVDNQELIVIASHWTSQLKQGSETRRDVYADKIYGEANAIWHANSKADVIVCGDFNETPQSEAVTEHLHATADLRSLQSRDGLHFLNLMADKNPEQGFGTHFYHNHWFTYDQILISPGLLDNQGWTCNPNSVQVINNLTQPSDKHHRPWRFGGEHEKGPRGYSDHFPVTVKLRVGRP